MFQSGHLKSFTVHSQELAACRGIKFHAKCSLKACGFLEGKFISQMDTEASNFFFSFSFFSISIQVRNKLSTLGGLCMFCYVQSFKNGQIVYLCLKLTI